MLYCWYMSQKSKTIQSSPSNLGVHLLSLFITIFKRVFLKLFMIPLYGAIAAPWLILLVENTSEATQKNAHKVVALLAGKPGAETLHEGDLAIAVVILLIIVQSGFILFDKLQGKKPEGGALQHRTSKRILITEVVLCVFGWTLLAINQYDELGVQGMIILPGLAIAVSSLFFLENVLKDFFVHIQQMIFGQKQ